jgi:CheY-like chemotaxis protein
MKYPIYKVLIIDDGRGILRTLKQHLRHIEGVEIEVFLNSSNALALMLHDRLKNLPPPETASVFYPSPRWKTGVFRAIQFYSHGAYIAVISDLNMPMRGKIVAEICHQKKLRCIKHSRNREWTDVAKLDLEALEKCVIQERDIARHNWLLAQKKMIVPNYY